MAQPVQLPRRQLQMTAAARPADQSCGAHSAELGLETLVGRRQFRRDTRGEFIARCARRCSLFVDRSLCEAELLAGKRQLLDACGGALLERGQLLIERLQSFHDLELLVLDLSPLATEGCGLLTHRLFVPIGAGSPRTQALLDGRDPLTYGLRSGIEGQLLRCELVALLSGLDDSGSLLGKPGAQLRHRGSLGQLTATVGEAIEPKVLLLKL